MPRAPDGRLLGCSAVEGDDLHHHLACPRLASSAAQGGRRPPPWVGIGNLRVAALALPTNRPDMRSPAVWAFIAYHSHLAARLARPSDTDRVPAHPPRGHPLHGCALVPRQGRHFWHAARSRASCVVGLALTCCHVRSGRVSSSSTPWSAKLFGVPILLLRFPPRSPSSIGCSRALCLRIGLLCGCCCC